MCHLIIVRSCSSENFADLSATHFSPTRIKLMLDKRPSQDFQ
jgi:hypothetical protein